MQNLMRSIVLLAIVMSPGLTRAQEAAEPMRFVVLSDTRGVLQVPVNRPALEMFSQIILELDPPAQFVIIVGDLVRGVKDDQVMYDQFGIWIDAMEPLYASDMWGEKIYPLPGNHDMGSPNAMEVWQNTFVNLPDNGPDDDKQGSYWFDVGPCRIVAINTDRPGNRQRMDLDWLDEALATSDKAINLVFGHQPAYPVDGHIGRSLDKYPELRDEFWDILAAHGVQAYFTGHEHLYDHAIHNGVHHIITGGGGGPMIPLLPGAFFHYLIIDATETDATVQVIDLDDRLREQFKLTDTEVKDIDLRGDFSDMLLSLLPCAMLAMLPAVGLCCLAVQQLVRRY